MEHWPDVFYNVMCLLFSTVQFRKIAFYKLQDRETYLIYGYHFNFLDCLKQPKYFPRWDSGSLEQYHLSSDYYKLHYKLVNLHSLFYSILTISENWLWDLDYYYLHFFDVRLKGEKFGQGLGVMCKAGGLDSKTAFESFILLSSGKAFPSMTSITDPGTFVLRDGFITNTPVLTLHRRQPFLWLNKNAVLSFPSNQPMFAFSILQNRWHSLYNWRKLACHP